RYQISNPVEGALRDQAIKDARTLVDALGYDMDTVEFAVKDGVLYAIDFLNPAPDFDNFSIQEDNFRWVLEKMSDLVLSYARAVSAAEGVHSALAALERAVLQDEDLRRELGLEPEEERLALADPGFTFSSPSVRLDSFFADEVRFVEYNAESPAGMAYSDNLAAIFAGLPVMKAFRKQFRGRFQPTPRR